MPPLPPTHTHLLLQRGSSKAAAAALAAPTEAECGLTVDADVAEEQLRQRQRCASYLRQTSGSSSCSSGDLSGGLPAEAVLLPAQAVAALVMVPAGGGMGSPGSLKIIAGDGDGKLAPAEIPTLIPASGGGGDEVALTGQPYAVEMFGLRKVYKVHGA